LEFLGKLVKAVLDRGQFFPIIPFRKIKLNASDSAFAAAKEELR
jgi:hypothetical protein